MAGCNSPGREYFRGLAAVGLCAGLMWLAGPIAANAQALRFQPQGAAAVAQGNAFSAQADDASAIHYNPAGLGQVEGVQVVLGAAVMGGSIAANTAAGAFVHGDFGGSAVMPPPSHAYVSANLGSLGLEQLSRVSVGLGLTSPFGLNTRYPVDGPFNSAVTSAALPLIAIKPTVAYKMTDNLSVGLNADIYTFASFLGEGHVEQKQVGIGGGSLELNGKGTSAGVTASLLYTPLRNSAGKPIASVGFVYRSQAVLPLHGSFLVNGGRAADASTTFVFPPIYTSAVAVWPVRDRAREWKIELDVEYVGWRSMRNLDVHLSTGQTLSQPQQWKNVPVVAVGTEYKWLHPDWLPQWQVAVRAGYTRTENPVPDQTFNPGTISLSAHTISLGAGFLCTKDGWFLDLIPCGGDSGLWPKAIGFDVAYQEWIYEPHTVAGNLNPTVNGTYDADVHLGMFSFKLLF